MISRCSSPMPEMMVCPDSSSVRTRNEGSSCARRCSARPIFSWSPLVLGSTATWITGSGNSIFSRKITSSGSHSVSPVVTSLRPTAAAISPARTSLISSRWLACICSRRPMRSLRPRFVLYTVSPELSTPEYTRLTVGCLAERGFALLVLAFDRLDVDRRRHVVDHRIEHRLHTLVFESASAEHRHDLVLDRAHAQAPLDVLDREIVALEVLVR